MSPVLGIIASSNQQGRGGGPVGAYDALASVTLSATTSSIIFAGIPAGYQHLQIRGIARTTAAGNNYSMVVGVNDDTTVSNYRSHYLFGLGSGTPTAGTYQSEAGYYATNSVAGDGAGTSVFGVCIIDLLDYANTSKNKTFRGLMGQDRNGSGIAEINSGVWLNTNAITSLKINVAGGNFAIYSQLALYGVK
jgi:hypothetical protein